MKEIKNAPSSLENEHSHVMWEVEDLDKERTTSWALQGRHASTTSHQVQAHTPFIQCSNATSGSAVSMVLVRKLGLEIISYWIKDYSKSPVQWVFLSLSLFPPCPV